MATTPIRFVDMARREREARQVLQRELDALNRLDKPSIDQQERMRTIQIVLSIPDLLVDPLFKAIQLELGKTCDDVVDHSDGMLANKSAKSAGYADLNQRERELAAVYGILQADSTTNPDYEPLDALEFGEETVTEVKTAYPTTQLGRRFVRAVAAARGEYSASRELFDETLRLLAEDGRVAGDDKKGVHEVDTEQWANVARALQAQGVDSGDRHLPLKVRLALANTSGADDGGPRSAVAIDLPDLEEQADIEIVADNLHAMQALYFSAMLEELRMFQVVDKLVEQFMLGMLPVSKGKAGDFLYAYWKRSVERFSEIERRNLYSRAFGLPGGDASQGTPNRDFHDLFLRFVSAVSSYTRQFTVENLLRSSVPGQVSQEHVRKAGRDLAANLSLHGYGIAYFAATELQAQIKEIIELLSDDEIKSSYGARDMFQVIEQVSTLELGGARNTVRYRTLANSGAIIFRWLADHADALASSSRAPVLDPLKLTDTTPRRRGSKATTDPTDRDLVDACEAYLAVTGTADSAIEEYSQPYESPVTTSRPISIPNLARDMLDSAGIPANGFSRN